jgi:dGTPase
MINKLYKKSDYTRFSHEPINNAPWRSEFRRDYARLIHSPAFRRLTYKTQLFPGEESDFFRNRLTHSLEVAQICKSIGQKINFEHEFFKKNNLDLDLLEFAGLAHDIGHPPFGHIGERALDDHMKPFGGFEGNAQTLRILAVLEKKVKIQGSNSVGFKDGRNARLGLNLTFRTLASILKYDSIIPQERELTSKLSKGYYTSESHLVTQIKEHVTGIKNYNGYFKTIECDIMDIADDIAYSTFDLEDSFKAGFINPINFITIDANILTKVHKKVIANSQLANLTEADVQGILITFISSVLKRENFPELKGVDLNSNGWLMAVAGHFFNTSKQIADNGYLRYKFTSALINEFISGITVELNEEMPSLSKVKVSTKVKAKIECVKHFIFYSITMSNRLKIPEYRGYEIVNSILKILNEVDSNPGFEILPSDFRMIYNESKEPSHVKRTICDYVTGMTDRYVVEFYGRLKSENPQTIFKST